MLIDIIRFRCGLSSGKEHCIRPVLAAAVAVAAEAAGRTGLSR
jgi:hypothetical protein